MKNKHIFFATIILMFCIKTNLFSMDPQREELIVRDTFLKRAKSGRTISKQDDFIQKIRDQNGTVAFAPTVRTFFIPMSKAVSNTGKKRKKYIVSERKKCPISEDKKKFYHRKKYLCSWEGCPFEFSSPAHVQRHMVKHTKEKLFACDTCKKNFSYKHTWVRHKCKVLGNTNSKV